MKDDKYTFEQLVQAANIGHDFMSTVADSVPFDTIEEYLIYKMGLSL